MQIVHLVSVFVSQPSTLAVRIHVDQDATYWRESVLQCFQNVNIVKKLAVFDWEKDFIYFFIAKDFYMNWYLALFVCDAFSVIIVAPKSHGFLK